MQSNYRVRKYLFFNRTSNWQQGQRAVLFFFTTDAAQCAEYLQAFARLAFLNPHNYYLFVTAEYNSVQMHALDAVPLLLNYNILNDDRTFFGFLRAYSTPCVQFYSELGRLECECHPASGQVRSYLAKRPNAFFKETDTYKRKVASVMADEANVICQIRRSEERDRQIKNQFSEYSLKDINRLYEPIKTSKAPLKRRIPDYPFVDGVGRGFLQQNLSENVTSDPSPRQQPHSLQGVSHTKDRYRFGFESDLNMKCDEIRRFRADVVVLGRKQHTFIPKRLVLYRDEILRSDTSHLY